MLQDNELDYSLIRKELQSEFYLIDFIWINPEEPQFLNVRIKAQSGQTKTYKVRRPSCDLEMLMENKQGYRELGYKRGYPYEEVFSFSKSEAITWETFFSGTSEGKLPNEAALDEWVRSNSLSEVEEFKDMPLGEAQTYLKDYILLSIDAGLEGNWKRIGKISIPYPLLISLFMRNEGNIKKIIVTLSTTYLVMGANFCISKPKRL